MEYVVIMMLAIVLGAVAGVVLLAQGLLNARMAASRSREESKVYESGRDLVFQKCYNDCMGTEYSIPVTGEECLAFCRAM